MQAGVINRFRVLPMSRSAVVVGRVLSDLVLNGASLVVMAVTGLVVGWCVHDRIANAALAFGLLLLFSFALSWIMAYIGLVVRGVEVVNNASLMVIFPLTFIANTLVASDTLPTVLRTIAEWNPISTVTHAARDLFGNMPAAAPEPSPGRCDTPSSTRSDGSWPLSRSSRRWPSTATGQPTAAVEAYRPVTTRNERAPSRAYLLFDAPGDHHLTIDPAAHNLPAINRYAKVGLRAGWRPCGHSGRSGPSR
jgi:ABC-2 type transporter